MAGLLWMMLGSCVGDPQLTREGHKASFCNEPSDRLIRDWETQLTGSWKQVLSSYFLVSTDLVDMNCVDLEIRMANKVPLAFQINQSSIQHENPALKVHTSYTLKDADLIDGYWVFNNTKHRPGYRLRCARTWAGDDDVEEIKPFDVAVWTGTDNLSMMVWTRDVGEFYKTHSRNVTAFLKSIDFTGRYKRPIVTYDEKVCHGDDV